MRLVPHDAETSDQRGAGMTEVLLTKDEVLTKIRRRSATTLDRYRRETGLPPPLRRAATNSTASL